MKLKLLILATLISLTTRTPALANDVHILDVGVANYDGGTEGVPLSTTLRVTIATLRQVEKKYPGDLVHYYINDINPIGLEVTRKHLHEVIESDSDLKRHVVLEAPIQGNAFAITPPPGVEKFDEIHFSNPSYAMARGMTDTLMIHSVARLALISKTGIVFTMHEKFIAEIFHEVFNLVRDESHGVLATGLPFCAISILATNAFFGADKSKIKIPLKEELLLGEVAVRSSSIQPGIPGREAVDPKTGKNYTNYSASLHISSEPSEDFLRSF